MPKNKLRSLAWSGISPSLVQRDNVVHFSTGSSSRVQCSFHLYLKLPPLLFEDPHELAQRNNTYSFNHWVRRDLEKLVHALPQTERGSDDVLLNVRLLSSIVDNRKPFETGSVSWNLTVDLPMHLRYVVPAPVSSTSKLTRLLHPCYVKHFVSYFLSFFPCFHDLSTLVDNPTQLPASSPSYVTLSLPKTPPNIFITISAHTEFLSGKAYMNVTTIPLGSILDLPLVELGKTLTIIIYFFWLARVSKSTSNASSSSSLKTGIENVSAYFSEF